MDRRRGRGRLVLPRPPDDQRLLSMAGVREILVRVVRVQKIASLWIVRELRTCVTFLWRCLLLCILLR